MAWLIFAIGGSGKHESSLEEIPKCSPTTQSYLYTENKELSPKPKKKSHLHIATGVGQICQGGNFQLENFKANTD